MCISDLSSDVCSSDLVSICVLALIACTKEERHIPCEQSDRVPDPLRNVMVENLPGGAKLTYKVPDDPNLLYVKAEFETQGEIRNVKASYYENTLRQDGFGDTL